MASGEKSRIRVVVADDSKVMRALLTAMIEDSEDFDVVGIAENGREVVDLAQELRPDVILMDVHMPEMDGHAATRQIMETVPTPVVMISASLRASEVSLSFEALRAGALTIMDKPVDPLSPRHEEAAKELRRTLRLMSEVRVVHRRRMGAALESDNGQMETLASGRRVEIVAVASSTGGPSALSTMLEALPAPASVPIVIVQHISEGFVEGLAAWLSKRARHHVMVARDQQELTPGRVWLAPDGGHLVVNSARRLLVSAPSVGDHICPSGDRLLASVAAAYGSKAMGVVLTGMGSDGAAGLLEIARRQGITAAQGEESCVVYGMPRKAVEIGAASNVGSPSEIGDLIARVTQQPVSRTSDRKIL